MKKTKELRGSIGINIKTRINKLLHINSLFTVENIF